MKRVLVPLARVQVRHARVDEVGERKVAGGSSRTVEWGRLRAMPSARLFVMRKGDAVFLPAGTYHYVYTIKTKVAVAVDYLSAARWAAREASVARDRRIDGNASGEQIGALAKIFEHGVLAVERRRMEEEAAAGRGNTPAAIRLADGRRRELGEVLAWAEQLRSEAASAGAPAWPSHIGEAPSERGLLLRDTLARLWCHLQGREHPCAECPW